MKILKKGLVLLFLVFVIAQFFRPEKNQGNLASVDPFLKETTPPDDVKKILQNACFDCHTDYSVYPWYSNITPVNYWMAGHIKDGKKHLNFSKWADYTLKRKDHKFDELIEEVKEQHMPLNSYTWTHQDAKLSEEQINQVIAWAKTVRDNLAKQH